MAHPAAYLRRSYVDTDSPGDISREAQRTAVRRLAEADGYNGELVEYDDWGVSADVAMSARRTAYTRLLADMEAGDVCAVYAFDVDRLYRDPRDLIRLQDAADAHSVRVVTTGGPLPIGEGADPAAEAFAFISAIFGRLELQKAKKRARAAREARKQRGDRMGHAPYGYKHVHDETGRVIRVPNPEQPLQPILDAVREAGTILGACRLLESRRIPAPRGGTEWATSALTRIVEREAPELLPRKGPSGTRVRSTALLAQLVRCHCGQTMTPNVTRGQLYCRLGPKQRATHPRYVVREVDLVPWIRGEADRLTLVDSDGKPFDRVERRREAEVELLALEEKRERVKDMYADGVIDKAERDRRLAEATAKQEKLRERERVIAEVPPYIDWTYEPADVNRLLRLLFDYVQLDEDMRPVAAVWRNPDLRG